MTEPAPAQISALIDQYGADQYAAGVAACEVQLASVTGERDGLQAEVVDLQAQVDDLKDQLLSAFSQIDKLQDALDQWRPRTLFGSSISRNAGETYPLAYQRIVKAIGLPDFTNLYDGGAGLPAVLNAGKQVGWPTVPTFLSANYNPDETLKGTYDAAFLTAAKQLTERDRICIWKEQDHQLVIHALPNFQAFLDTWTHFYTLAKTNGVKAKFVQVWTGDLKDRLDQYVGDDWCDEIAYDPYTHTPGQTALELVKPTLDAVRAHGITKPVGIREISYDLGKGFTQDQVTAFVQSLAELRGLVPFVSWFQAFGYGIDTNPAAAAAYRALIGGSA